jgi:hypothetical protein
MPQDPHLEIHHPGFSATGTLAAPSQQQVCRRMACIANACEPLGRKEVRLAICLVQATEPSDKCSIWQEGAPALWYTVPCRNSGRPVACASASEPGGEQPCRTIPTGFEHVRGNAQEPHALPQCPPAWSTVPEVHARCHQIAYSAIRNGRSRAVKLSHRLPVTCSLGPTTTRHTPQTL